VQTARRTGQLAIAVFLFWLVLAVPVGAADLAWGIIAAVLAGGLFSVLLQRRDKGGIAARGILGLVFHTFDLVRSIVPAALQVARVVLDPALPIQPKIIVHQVRLKSELERVTLANTITLTPGTHCVDLDGDRMTIHCLAPGFADAILDGRIEKRIARSLGKSITDG